MKARHTPTLVLLTLLLTSCFQEDVGPKQEDQASYAILDFDRLEIADAIDVTVTQGTTFSIVANGDRRNLNDLRITKNGSTLVAQFDGNQRQYTTYLTITMPVLHGFDFSGAVNGIIEGFEETTRFDLSLSGASVAQLDADADEIYANLTGASQLRLNGTGEKIDASISGASSLSAFEFPVSEARLIVTGASHARIFASQKLMVSASGGSDVVYRGTPQLESDVTGASIVNKD